MTHIIFGKSKDHIKPHFDLFVTTISMSRKFFQSASWKRQCHWHEQHYLDTHGKWEISQSECEISSNCGKNNWFHTPLKFFQREQSCQDGPSGDWKDTVEVNGYLEGKEVTWNSLKVLSVISNTTLANANIEYAKSHLNKRSWMNITLFTQFSRVLDCVFWISSNNNSVRLVWVWKLCFNFTLGTVQFGIFLCCDVHGNIWWL